MVSSERSFRNKTTLHRPGCITVHINTVIRWILLWLDKPTFQQRRCGTELASRTLFGVHIDDLLRGEICCGSTRHELGPRNKMWVVATDPFAFRGIAETPSHSKLLNFLLTLNVP